MNARKACNCVGRDTNRNNIGAFNTSRKSPVSRLVYIFLVYHINLYSSSRTLQIYTEVVFTIAKEKQMYNTVT